MPTKKPRISVTVDPKTLERAQYWADKRKMSLSEYLGLAVIKQIEHETSDFDISNLGIQRLDQLIEAVMVLSSNVENLEQSQAKGFNSLIGLTRGDNYLLSEDTGELTE
mgnify:CR=1 FL=1